MFSSTLNSKVFKKKNLLLFVFKDRGCLGFCDASNISSCEQNVFTQHRHFTSFPKAHTTALYYILHIHRKRS